MNILGMGIDAIEVKTLPFKTENPMINISLRKIMVGKYQPRKTGIITDESIQDLVASMKEQGVLQPIIVRKIDGGRYELIAGERRYRSAIKADLTEIPCVIKDVSEKDAFAIALIENIQREQLSLLEESESLLKLKEEHALSVDEVSKIIGKPRTTVANLIRVASLLSPEGKLLWEKGDVNYGHIRSVIVLEHHLQNIVLQYIIKNELSVRAAEQLINEKKYLRFNDETPKKNINKSSVLGNELMAIMDEFSIVHGKKIVIKPLGSGKMKLSIEFDNVENILLYLKEQINS